MTACGPSEESRARAEEWCTRKAIQAAADKIPLYSPSQDEIIRGHQAFMRECMKNQGYEFQSRLGREPVAVKVEEKPPCKREAEEENSRDPKERERELREEQVRADERAKGGRDALLRQAAEILVAYKFDQLMGPPTQSTRTSCKIMVRIDAIWEDLDKASASDEGLIELRTELANAYNGLVNKVGPPHGGR